MIEFAHYLTLALGFRTRTQLLSEMTVNEFLDWQAYFARAPFGFLRDNMHAAHLSTIVANAHRGKNQRAFKPEDFMIKSEKQRKHDESWATIKAMMHMAKPKKQANGRSR